MLIIDNRESVFDTLIVLTDNYLFVGTKTDEKLDKALEGLQSASSDNDIEALVDGKAIALEDIKKVSCNIHSELVYVKHKTPKETREQSISCQDQKTTEQLLSALKEKLSFNEKRVQYGPTRAAIKPSIFVAISAFITYVLFGAAQAVAANPDVELSGRRQGLKAAFVWVMEFLGPTGVVILGGLITLLCAYWLVKRVKTPPLMCTLQPA